MLRHLLAQMQEARTLSDVLAARPGLLDMQELDDTEKDRCLELLSKLGAQRLPAAVTALLPHLADPVRAGRLATIIRTLPTATAAHCIVGASDLRTEPAPELSSLCDDLAASLLARSLTVERVGARSLQSLSLELLTRSRSTDYPRAMQTLHGLSRSSEQPIRAARQAAEFDHRGLRKALSALAIESAVGSLRRPADAAAIWHELRAVHADEGETELLRQLLRHAFRQRGAIANAVVLGWIARDLLPSHPKLLSVNRRLRDQEADGLAHDVVAGIPMWCLEEVDPYVKSADRRFRAWWQDLVDHRRKLEPRRPRVKR
jgi:hypothetical protein